MSLTVNQLGLCLSLAPEPLSEGFPASIYSPLCLTFIKSVLLKWSLFLFSSPLILLWVISTPIPSVWRYPPHLYFQSRILFWTHIWAEKTLPITLIIYLCFSPECLERTLYIIHLLLCLLFVFHNKIRGMQALCFLNFISFSLLYPLSQKQHLGT